jgi:ABC-2 type transport system permease protein
MNKNTFINMLLFEWRYFFKQPSFIVTSLLFFVLPFFTIAIEQLQIASGGNLQANGATATAQVMLIFGVFAMFLVVNFVASTALRNDTMGMSEILYTKPIQPFAYQCGRFTGAYLMVLTVSLMVPLGLFVGSLMPWLDPQRLGDFNLSAYVSPYLLFTIPTSFVLSTIFYAAALRFRNIMAVYLFALAIFVLHGASGAIFNDPSQREILAISDPFGIRAFSEATRYWSPVQKNTDVVILSGNILINRLLWIGIGIVILFGVGKVMSPLTIFMRKENKSVSSSGMVHALENNIKYKFSSGAHFNQFTMRLFFEIKQVFMSPGFIVLLAIAAFIVVKEFVSPQGIYGNSSWPLTQYMVELIQAAFSLSIVIVITFYTAEVVWRERSTGIGDIIDASPVHNFTFWFSKLLAVCLIIIVLMAVGMLSTLANQLLKGHLHFDFYQYFVSLLYFTILPQIYLVILAFFIQALSPNKYLGMLIFVGYFFVSLVFTEIGLEHNMFNYAASPILQYSDMNGYAWFLQTQHYYMAYWGFLALVLSAFSYALWQRGPETNIKARLILIGYALGKKGQTVVVLGIAAFISVGTVIYYNTQVSNDFVSTKELVSIRGEYEKAYAQYSQEPIPTVTAVDLNVAIFPGRRKIELIAKLQLQNKTNQALQKFLVNYPMFSATEISGANISDYNTTFKTAWMSFDKPLASGEKTELIVRLNRQHVGFKDNNEDLALLKNGTFIDNYALLPSFGVNKAIYLSDQHQRRKQDLPPPKRAYQLEDESRYGEAFLGAQIGMIDFKATLSTSSDQIAIAPGNLQDYWVDSERNYFVYKANAPMLNFYSILSARLKAKTQAHNGVEIAVFYHKDHAWNIDTMIESTKDSIDLFSEVFGPYQHKHMRIIEFPRYRSFAQSFANTVPYSEEMGFITDLRDKSEIDSVYYITAHEVAHQWFGHQLVAANVQGSAVLSETLSQYAALQLMIQKYGEAKLRKFLSFELDTYLSGRANEYLAEMPLMRAENQNYIHYNKGSVVMMAIADRIGFDKTNLAIKSLIVDFPFSGTRLATTLDLLSALKAYAQPQDHAFIEQQFTQINLYNIKVSDAVFIENSRSVSLDIDIARTIADGEGNERAADFDDLVDIVVFSDDPNSFDSDTQILYRQKHRLTNGQNQLEIKLSSDVLKTARPAYAGADPFIRYIDRDSKDNIRKLKSN